MAVLSSWGQWNVWNGDTVNSVWSGINGTQGNETITLAARPAGGWSVLDAREGFDTVELTFLGVTGNQDSASQIFYSSDTATDWVLQAVNVERFVAATNVIADQNPWSHVDLYLTAGVNNFSTDGSIRSVYGTGGSQNIVWDSGVTNNLFATNYNGYRYTTFAATQDGNSTQAGLQSLVMADNNNSTAQAANDVQRGGQRDFEENFIVVDLGAGNDSIVLSGHSLTVDNRYWVNTFLWWGYHHYDQYVVSEWTLYYADWDGASYLHAYNNFKDYTIQFRNVESVTVSYAPTLGPGSGGSSTSPGVHTPVDPRSVYTPAGVDPTDAGFGDPIYNPTGGTPTTGPYSPNYTPPGGGADPTDPTGSGGFGDPWATDPIPYNPTDGSTAGSTPASGVLTDPVVVLPRSTSASTSALSAGYVLGVSAPTDNAKARYFMREIDNNPGVDIDPVTGGNQDRIRLSGDNNAASTTDTSTALVGAGFKQVNLVAQQAVTTAQIQYQVFTDSGLSNEIVILGTNSPDTITSVSSTSQVGIYGFDGNDTITGGTSNEIILGGSGLDIIDTSTGDDYVDGEAGNDNIQGGTGNDTLLGGEGNDVLHANSVANGTGDADIVNGGAGNDTIYAAGNDIVDGGAGDDNLVANNGGTASRTYFTDNTDNNIITTDGNDAVYFGAPLASGQAAAVGVNTTVARANYTNTVNNAASETVTMLLEYGATARSVALESADSANSESNQTVAAISLYLSDVSRSATDLRSAANSNFDLVNIYGGDVYDTGFHDNTITFIWTFYSWRQYYTIPGQDDDNSIYTSARNNAFTNLSNISTLSDWLSDGESYYGNPRGAFSPWDNDAWRSWDASTTNSNNLQVQNGWSGYLNFYLSEVNKTYVWYAKDSSGNGLISLSASNSELTYIGSINGRSGNSLQYASLLDGGLTQQVTETVVINPPMPVILKMAAADDTGDSNNDGLTYQLTNLTLTGFVDNAITGGRMYRWYDGIDLNGDGDTTDTHTSLVGVTESAANADFDQDGTIEDAITVGTVTQVSETMYGIDFDRDGFLESDLRAVNAVAETAASKPLVFEWIDSDADGNFDLGEFGSGSLTRLVDANSNSLTDAGDTVSINSAVKLVLGSAAILTTSEYDENNQPTVTGKSIQIDLTEKSGQEYHKYVLEQTTGTGASTAVSEVTSETAATVHIDVVTPGLTLALSGSIGSLRGSVNESATIGLYVADNVMVTDAGTDSDVLEAGGNVYVAPGAANNYKEFTVQPRSVIYDAWMEARDLAGNLTSTENTKRIAFGTAGADTITTSNIDTFVYGFDGADAIVGGTGNDNIFPDSLVTAVKETFTLTLQAGVSSGVVTFDSVTFNGETVTVANATNVDAVGAAIAATAFTKWDVSYSAGSDTLTFVQKTGMELSIPDVQSFNITDPLGVLGVVTTTQQGLTGSAGGANDTVTAGAGADVIDLSGGGADTLIFNVQASSRVANSGVNPTGGSSDSQQSSRDTVVGFAAGDAVRVAITNVQQFDGTSTDFVSVGVVTNYYAQYRANSYTLDNTFTGTALGGDNGILSIDTGTNGAVANAFIAATSYQLTGTSGSDTIGGGTNTDTIIGGTGDDVITAYAGADSLLGGAGNDTFRYTNAAQLGTDTINGGDDTDQILFTTAGTFVDSDFASALVTSVESIGLTGASTVTLGSATTSLGLNTVQTGAGATTVNRSNTTATTVNAQALANDTLLTIDDLGAAANFTVTNLTGDLNAAAVEGTLNVGLGNNADDNDIAIVIADKNATITGGAAGDTLNITQMDDPQVTGIQTVDLSGNLSNVNIVLGGGRQTIKAGVGVYTINTGSGDGTGEDRVEFLATGSADVPNDLTVNDSTLISQLSSISQYNGEAIDFIGTDTVAANLTVGGFTTNANGVVTAFGGGVTAGSTLGQKMAAVKTAMDQFSGLGGDGTNRVVIFTHLDTANARTDTYAYGTGLVAANDDQVVRIVDDSLNEITTGSSFILSVAPPLNAVTTSTSLLPSEVTWSTGVMTVTPSGFTPGSDGNTSTSAGDYVNGNTNQLIRNSAGNFGTIQGSGDDYSRPISIPTGLWATGMNMFGTVYTQLHMGSNGYVTFGTGYSGYTPSGIDTYTRSPMIAAQFDDLYTGAGARNITDGAGSGTSLNSHNMFYYEEGNKMVFTWDNVGLYSNGVSDSQTSSGGRGSAFQIIFHKTEAGNSSQNFGMEIRYEEVSLQSAAATAGWTAGDRVNFGLVNPSKSNLHTTAFSSNVGINGVWAWGVSGGVVSTETFIPDVGLTAAKDTNSFSVRGMTADAYAISGEAASHFTVVNTGNNTAKLTTIANAKFNLWKDQFVDGVASVTVTPSASGNPGVAETVNINVVRNQDGNVDMPGDADTAVRNAAGTISVAVGGSLVDGSDSDLGSASIMVGATTYLPVTTINATGSGSTINISNQTENFTINGNTGVDSLTSGSGNDTVSGGVGQDAVSTGGGNDRVIMAVAAGDLDQIDAGEASETTGDTLVLSGTAAATVTVNLSVSAGADQLTDGVDALTQSNFENLDAASMLGVGVNATAASTGSVLIGTAQNDTLVGGNGIDTFTPGAGNNTVTGGAGLDLFSLGAANSHNYIQDFGLGGSEVLQMGSQSNAYVTALLGANYTSTANTWSRAGSNDRVAFNTAGYSLDLTLSSTFPTSGAGFTINVTNSTSKTFTGSFYSDIFVYTANPVGDTIVESGSGSFLTWSGADTLYLNGSIDVSSGLTATFDGAGTEGIEQIVVQSGASATMSATQLAGKILNIAEDAGTGNTVLFVSDAQGTQTFANLTFTTGAGTSGTVTQSARAFNAFDDGSDKLLITIASSGTNVITGTSIGDIFFAGTQAGSLSLNGGSGTDELRVTSDIFLAGWNSVENITLSNDGVDVSIVSSLLSTSGLASVTGNTTASAIEYIKVAGGDGGEAINFAGITFTNAAVSITGGTGDDTITGSTGVDQLNGGDGLDTFVYSNANQTDQTNTVSQMDVITGFNILDDKLNLSSFALGGTLPTATVDASDSDSYVVSWTKNSTTNYIYLKDTGVTGGLTLSNNGGLYTPAATSPSALALTLLSVSATGFNVTGDGPFRAYFTSTTPVRNDTGTYFTQSNNVGASTPYTYSLADIDPSSGVRTGFITIQSTNAGSNTTYDGIVYIGGADNAAETIPVTLSSLPGPANAADLAIVYGQGGNDTITGSAGNDSIFGGAGNDSVTGGAGADYFGVDAGTDTITDLGGSNVGNGVTDYDADILVVSAGATANVNVSDDWTATAATINNGTATLTLASNDAAAIANSQNDGVDINLSAATGTSGFTVNARNTSATVIGVAWAANDIVGTSRADTIYVGPNAGNYTLGAGADRVIFSTALGGSAPGGSAGLTNVVGFLGISDYLSGTDIIDLDTVNITIVAEGSIASAGMASISSSGLASFNGGDNNNYKKLVAVENAMTAGTADMGETAFWSDGSDTYVFISDGVALLTSNDHLIKLIGLVNPTVMTISGGDITAIS